MIRSPTLILLILVLPTLASLTFVQDTSARTLMFSGYAWEVRQQGISGPGPNHWNPGNAWVDKNGNLHLKITRVKGATRDEWHCAEIISKQKFGFGQYEFQTVGRLDRLDPNVVLGLFDYGTYGEESGPTNEIDIEFARWGKREYPNGNFTIYPASGARGTGDSFTFEYSLPDTLPGGLATHRFTRTKDRVALATFTGNGKAGAKALAQWTYAPSEPRLIPQKPLAVHLNLWLFQGKPPTDGNTVEVVVRKFVFTPFAEPPVGE